jgi:hypothetical protein
MRGSQGIGSGPSSSKIEDEPSPLHFRLRTASPRQVAAPRNEDDLAARNAETRAQLGTAPERGCGEAQPQHVQISNRFRHSTAPGEAKLLRLVSATQPRSVFGGSVRMRPRRREPQLRVDPPSRKRYGGQGVERQINQHPHGPILSTNQGAGGQPNELRVYG